MFPIATLQNGLNSTARYVFASKSILRLTDSLTDFQYLVSGQFMCRAQFATPVRVPPFGHFVAHIIQLGSKKQVIRSYARRIVATVQDLFLGCNHGNSKRINTDIKSSRGSGRGSYGGCDTDY